MRGLFIKNSLKNLFRSKLKSLFFMTLVFILTVISCISLSVWVSIESYLDTCDDYYTTIGLLEYMSPEYPNEECYNQSMQDNIGGFDFSILTDNKNTISFDQIGRSLGYIEGYKRHDNLAPYSDAIVLIAEIEFDVDESGEIEILSSWARQPLFSAVDLVNKPLSIHNVEDYLTEYPLGVHKKSFVFYGEKSQYGRSWSNTYDVVPFYYPSFIEHMDGQSDTLLFKDITGYEGDYTLDGDSVFSKIARTLFYTRHSVNAYGTENIESLLPFNQEQNHLISGRFFTQEEYNSSAKVCIISENTANRLDLNIGETINLSLSLIEGTTIYESYDYANGFTTSNEYKIVGITKTPKELNGDIYYPKDKLIDYSVNQLGYTIGTLQLINSGADAFYNEYINKLPEQFNLTIYDQGYSQAAKPLEDIHRIAILTAIASMLATLLVMVVYSYLYVYRQKTVSEIMLKLGTGKFAIYKYFLYGMTFVSLVSVAIGIFTSNRLFGVVKTMIKEALVGYNQRDLRYSNSNLSIIKNLDYNLDTDFIFFVYIGIGIILLTMICGIIFTYQSLKIKKKTKGIWRLKKKHKSSTRFGRVFKYSYLSILRGGLRTFLIVIFISAMIVFLGQLTNTLDGYKDNIEVLKADTEITVRFTDVKGRQVNKVAIEAFHLSDIIDAGYVKNYSITRAIPYHYLGLKQTGNEVFTVPALNPPTGGFVAERYWSDLLMGPKINFTNDIAKSPEFFYSSQMSIRYLEGYGDTSFKDPDSSDMVVAIPQSLANEHQIILGDLIKLYRHWDGYWFYKSVKEEEMAGITVKVIGIFESDAIKPNIFTPMGNLFSYNNFIEDSDEHRQYMYAHVFDSATFVLKDTSKIDEFRDFLTDYGFSEGTKISTYRAFIVINDKAFISTLDTLSQQLEHLNILYPILYLLVGSASFIIAYLVTLSRRKELSIMRGLGASKFKTLYTLFIEQLVLCILGLVIGLIISLYAFKGINIDHISLAIVVNIIYLSGTLAAIIMMNRMKVMKILKVED